MNVLVGTDGQEPAQTAVRFAAALAAQVRGRLFACYAVNYVTTPAFLTVPRTLETPPDLLKETGERALESAREITGVYGLEPVLQLLEGDTSGALLRYAHEIGADVIVLGTRAPSRAATILLGSTALETIRKSNRPIIVVPPHAARKFPEIRSIAVALDGSAPSHRAFQAAVAVARECRASLELCHVIDSERVTQSQHADATSYAVQLLEATALEAVEANIPVRKHVLEGARAGALEDSVKSIGCELLAMGSHGREGAGRILFGSVTEAALRLSTVPVLVHA